MKPHAGSAALGSGAVVDLADARDGRRLRELRLRLRAGVERNKSALGRLFLSGVVYTRAGARLGRELLLAYQHLLRASDLLARLDDAGLDHDGEAAAVERQVLAVLDRMAELSARSEGILGDP